MDNAVALAAIGLASTLAAGFFALVNKQNKTHEKIATALKDLALATREGNKEAKDRNGHLAEMVLEVRKDVMDSVQTVTEQNVEHQTVKQVSKE